MAVGVMKVRFVSKDDWHLAARAIEERCWPLAGGARQTLQRGMHTEALSDWVSIVRECGWVNCGFAERG
jgi:hypothetical protein